MATKPMRPACPPWCVTDHDKPMTTANGTPVLVDGQPLRWKGHESAHVWTDAGACASLGQMPGGPLNVAVTAPPAGTTLLAVDQARTLAEVLKTSGAVELGDAIGRTLARLDGQDDEQAPAAAEATDQGGACR